MDDAAFRASVFAEQKQVAAFSLKRPAERRDLVLKLLGITPLDAGARPGPRADAKVARDQVEQVRGLLAGRRRAAGGGRPGDGVGVGRGGRGRVRGSRGGRGGGGVWWRPTRPSSPLDAGAGRARGSCVRDGQGGAQASSTPARPGSPTRRRSWALLTSAPTELAAAQAASAGLEELESSSGWCGGGVGADRRSAGCRRRSSVAAPDDDGLEAARVAAEEQRAQLEGVSGEHRAAVAELDTGARAARSVGGAVGRGRLPDVRPAAGRRLRLGAGPPPARGRRGRGPGGGAGGVGAASWRRPRSAAAATLQEVVGRARGGAQGTAGVGAGCGPERAAAEAAVATAVAALGRRTSMTGEVERRCRSASRPARAAAEANQLVGQLRRQPEAERRAGRPSRSGWPTPRTAGRSCSTR